MFQDPKYFILAINRATGRQIPPHVPLMLFNARDSLALACAIAPYSNGCDSLASQEQRASARERVEAFRAFAENHGNEMKMPGAPTQPVELPEFPVSIDGHYTYWLSGGNVVAFVKPEDDNTLRPGTTTEEVLKMLIDRIQAQHALHASPENEDILAHLGEALAIQTARMKRMDTVISDLKSAQATLAADMGAVEKFGIKMHPCNSSNLAAFGYRADTGVLALEFKGGKVFHYPDVPEHVYNGLIEADSKGAYAHSHISTVYEGTRQQEPTQVTA
jgi:hypothetical protein